MSHTETDVLNAVLAERIRCAQLAHEIYNGATLLKDVGAARSSGYLLNAIVGKRIAVEGLDVPTNQEIEEAIREVKS